jgi:hypothetical protein
MRGNLLNKARRGELALRLPVGYRRLGDGAVVQDPDEAVRSALARIFERFAVLRNARAVQRHFAEQRLPMPRLTAAADRRSAPAIRPASPCGASRWRSGTSSCRASIRPTSATTSTC